MKDEKRRRLFRNFILHPSSLILLFIYGCRPAAPPPTAPPLQSALVMARYQALPPVVNAESGILFAEVAEKAGLHYRWTISGPRPRDILQTIGCGCAFLDYDADGNLDIFLVGERPALFKGDGKGHFTDVTQQAGLSDLHGHFLGVAVGDYDNDGHPDLYLSGYREGRLLHNESRKSKFVDVTGASGLKPQPFGTSCTFADFDGDGFLDLFVGNYVDFDPALGPRLCPKDGREAACSPTRYPALQGVLYRNVSGKRFADVTAAWNVGGAGGNLGVATADFNNSGRIGLAVANDEREGDLYVIGKGDKPFSNIRATSGTGKDRFGHNHAGMGIDWGDYDNDGLPDLFVATFAHEDKCLYRNLGDGVFEERGVETGVASALEPYVSFGAKFADFDNDGFLDLFIASGHVESNIADAGKGDAYRQPLELLHNRGGRSPAFARVTQSAGLAALPPIVGRGLAVGDYDNDGRMDALVVDSEGKPLLLHNVTGNGKREAGVGGGHWVGIRLLDKNGRDAYGATVTIETGGRKITRLCRADGSYLSSSDARVHFGLGATTAVDKITVRWPDGATETRAKIAADRYLDWKQKNK